MLRATITHTGHREQRHVRGNRLWRSNNREIGVVENTQQRSMPPYLPEPRSFGTRRAPRSPGQRMRDPCAMVSVSSGRDRLQYPLCCSDLPACLSFRRGVCREVSSHRKPAEERDPTEPSARQRTKRHASGDVSASLPETLLDGLPVSAQNPDTKGGSLGLMNVLCSLLTP